VADIARQTCTFVGLSKVLALGGEMDPGEVWYEFSDKCPPIASRMLTARMVKR
jgi:hypothetical protein